MRFLQGILIGILLLSGLTGKGDFHVHGSYDLDKDGHEETFTETVVNKQKIVNEIEILL